MTLTTLPPAGRTLDPALPGLSDVLSAHPPGAGQGEDCIVRHVHWVPRRECRVVHEVRTAGGGPTFVAREVTPSATSVHPMVADGALRGLAPALDPAAVGRRLARVCGGAVHSCRVTPVAYRPGARAVLAYDVVGASGPARYFAKLLSDGADRYAAAAAAMATCARERAAPAPVPDVVAVWRDLGTVVQRAARGRGLSQVVGDDDVALQECLRVARRLGGLLATVHATPAAAAPSWTADDELTQLEGLLAPAWHADPAVGRSLAALVDRLADQVPPHPDVVLCHGAFRTGQVLLDRERLSLVDLDTVSWSDAARDAGNALAYLAWADLRRALRPGLAVGLRRSLLDGYAEARAPLAAPALAWWATAAMAKIAGRRYRSLATGEWHLVPDLLALAAGGPGPALLPPDLPGGHLPAAGPGTARVPLPLDPDRMTAVLREELSTGVDGRLRVLEARPLTTAAGRRRVVRYLVEGFDGPGPVAVVGKLHAGRHRSSIAYENLRLLHDEVFAATPGLGVPAPVCHLPALRMVLYREADGTALDRLDLPAARRTAGALARWLTTLHGSTVVLTRCVELGHEVANAEAWAARVAAAAPPARKAAFALADRLAAAAARLPVTAQVPVHKDLHAGHVLLGAASPAGGPGIVVIDLDEARGGDPAMDVAHVCAYLETSRSPAAALTRDAFLAGYGPVPGDRPELRVAFFAAYTRMKIAKQLVSGSGPLRTPDGPARAQALHAVLTRGSTCLDT